MANYMKVKGKLVEIKPLPEDCIISRQPAKIHEYLAGAGKRTRHENAPTQYDENDKLIDDGLTEDDERTYWESFVDSKQAAELERRLAIVEAEDYEEGSEQFDEMED